MTSLHQGGSHARRHRAPVFLHHLLWTVGIALLLVLLIGTAFGARDAILQCGALVLFWLGVLAVIAVFEER